MTEQASLLCRAKERDPEALATIYDTYAPKIYAYIYRRVGDAQRAEDLTSGVFLKMLEALDNGKFARDALQSWLYRIAHNIIIDDVRRNKRRPTSSLHEGLALPTELGPEYLASERWQRARLLEAIHELTEDQRNVILLRFGEGLTAPEVAGILNKTEEAVRALQRRGLNSLRKHLANDPSARDLSATVVQERNP